MAKNAFTPELLRIWYYTAPPVSAVKPVVIPARTTVIELVTAGVVHFRWQNTELTVGCGALFWHVAGEETICRTEPDSPYECLVLGFTAPAQGGRPVPRLSMVSDPQRTRELCGELLRAYQDAAIDRSALGSYAYARLQWEAHLGSGRPATVLPPAAVSAGLAFIDSGFSHPDAGVSDIARSAGVSVPHLHALFREHLGQTPHQLLTARRIREAKWLLARTNTAIKAIANDCGFTNIETFYRAFKKYTGTAPHHFRRSNGASLLSHLARGLSTEEAVPGGRRVRRPGQAGR